MIRHACREYRIPTTRDLEQAVPPLVNDKASRETVTVWQCIGCGRIEAPQPCIGVCQDRKMELVDASLHQDVLSRLSEAREQAEALKTLVRQLAWSRPCEGQWERSYRAMQDRAVELLAALDSGHFG